MSISSRWGRRAAARPPLALAGDPGDDTTEALHAAPAAWDGTTWRGTSGAGLPPDELHREAALRQAIELTALAERGPAPAGPGPCRCDDCKYGHPPGTGTVLYTGPGGEWLREYAATRDGRYHDIPALADEAQFRADAGFNAAARHARQAIEQGHRRIAAVRAGAR